MRLTELSVARQRPPKADKYSWHPDSLLPSFGLRVYRTGRKAWGITRRWDGAKHPTFRKIGDYPDMLLADARTRAREILADPAAVEAHQTPPEDFGTNTFSTLAEAFLAHGRTKRGRILRAATVKEYRRALLTYAADLHDRPVTGDGRVRRGDIAAVIRRVATSSGPTTAMRTRAALSRFWTWMLANDLVEANIVAGTEGYETAKRSRVLTDGELAAIWSETEDRHDFNLIVRLCLWTGCRRSEAGGMKWSELGGSVWTVPGERTKNHRPLMLPLPRQAVAELDGWHRFVGRDFVFGRGPTGFQAWSQSKRRLDARLGFDRDWDLHDIRRTTETRMAGLGILKEHVNRVLNHAAGPVTAAYDLHDYLPEKREALQRWADELAGIVAQQRRIVALG